MHDALNKVLFGIMFFLLIKKVHKMNSKIVFSSEDSIEVQFEQRICPEVNAQVSVFAQIFREFTLEIAEIEEIVPAYCSVTVYFDSRSCSPEMIRNIALEVLEKTEERLAKNDGGIINSGHLVRIPVCYEGDDFAPDLRSIAEYTGLAEDKIVTLHSSPEYLVYMLGFLPGFPYLGGLDERLKVPRLETPRTRIPAGSIAIGGEQTGVYPVDSPGGWRILGRTPLKVFDALRTPAFLYKAGDRIKFDPISREEFDGFDEEKWLNENAGSLVQGEESIVSNHQKPRFVCAGGAKILDGGVLTTVQDLGRKGFQKYGIGESGAMDKGSFILANELAGNPINAACLEATLCGPEIQFTTDCTFALTGAKYDATLSGKSVPMNTAVAAHAGDVLKCGFASGGLRSYIAFRGGILVPPVFASASTNLKSRMGGYEGRKLEAGDEIAFGYVFCNKRDKEEMANCLARNCGKDGVLLLECVPGAQFDFFPADAVKKFTSTFYTISPESDRMGIRLLGESLECGKTDIISDAIPFGSVQITSSGLPVVMASDRQTTGGYAKIAAVTKKSMDELAQALPGTKVQFILKGVDKEK